LRFRLKRSHEMGKERAFHRMLQAFNSIHFPGLFNGPNRALFLASEAVRGASSGIVLRKTHCRQ
ncbi:MAG: hypothetical protein AB1664_18655, partial [Thermodesulfobacteriota bacterium]